MSFALGVWDAQVPPRPGDAERRYEQLCQGRDPVEVPSERVTAFVAECERRWPGDQARRTPAGFVANISADEATAVFGEWSEMAERHGLVMFDPQSGIVKIPSRLSFDADPPAIEVPPRLVFSPGRFLKRRRPR